MAEAPPLVIREARAEDLPALEWEGEYRRYRLVYQRAYAEALRGRRILLVAETARRRRRAGLRAGRTRPWAAGTDGPPTCTRSASAPKYGTAGSGPISCARQSPSCASAASPGC